MSITEDQARKIVQAEYGAQVKSKFFTQSYLDIYRIASSGVSLLELEIPGYDVKMIPSFLTDDYFNRVNMVTENIHERDISLETYNMILQLHPEGLSLNRNDIKFSNHLGTPVSVIQNMGSSWFVKYMRDIVDYYSYNDINLKRSDPAADEMVQQMGINIDIIIRDLMALILHRIVPYNGEVLDHLNSILSAFNTDLFDIKHNYRKTQEWERYASFIPFLGSILASEIRYNQNMGPLAWLNKNYPEVIQYFTKAASLVNM